MTAYLDHPMTNSLLCAQFSCALSFSSFRSSQILEDLYKVAVECLGTYTREVKPELGEEKTADLQFSVSIISISLPPLLPPPILPYSPPSFGRCPPPPCSSSTMMRSR